MEENTILIELSIDENTRIITIPNNGTIFGVVGDIEINRVRFSMPRYYSGFDLSEFVARVNYANPNGDANYYEADDVEGTENTVTFTWLMGPDVTAYAGDVKFSIKMYKKQNSKIVKVFNTKSSSGRVLDGFDVEKQITPEQQQTILDKLEADADKYLNEKSELIKNDFSSYARETKE